MITPHHKKNKKYRFMPGLCKNDMDYRRMRLSRWPPLTYVILKFFMR
ncbi:hypothetical protein EATG_01647 [Escherichia coli H605]|uniref:Uncharacterized protein n=1 Tax=Escherichia coli H605 TaxID=656410 RepID=A0AAJ3NWV8_ECOLX|nr:hypothetical protein EATG_01647 [Escherichia coli H605]